MSRRDELVALALGLLEAEGESALTMRRLAGAAGIRAPSLYKHVADKAELEALLAAEGLRMMERETPPGATLRELLVAYRAFALARPALYQLMTDRPFPRERLPEGLEDRAAAPLVAAAGGEDAGRALWAAAHGLVVLELADRFPRGADLDAAWDALADAFERRRRGSRARAGG